MRKNFFKGLLFCSFLLTISWYLNAAPPGVKATFVEGRAYYFPDPKVNKRKKIQVGISIPEKSLVQTKKAGKVELKFDDGTIVRVGPKTKLQLSKLVGKDGKNNTEFDLLSGRVWNKIKKQIGRKPQFKVKTRTAVAGVRGTIFGVDSFSEDSSIISVYEGTVDVMPTYARKKANIRDYMKGKPNKKRRRVKGPKKVSKERLENILLSRMQQLSVGKTKELTKRKDLDPKKYDAWTKWNLDRDSK